MIYELRTYYAPSGKEADLLSRFRNLTLGLFERHNMKLVGFWTPCSAGPETGTLVYILAFPDEAAKLAAWAAFQADPEWKAGKAASEANGKLTDKIVSVLMDPADFSPLK